MIYPLYVNSGSHQGTGLKNLMPSQ